MLPLLGEARFIEDADAVRAGVPLRHPSLQAIAHRFLAPLQQPQELLQRPGRLPCGVGHRFNALALQVAHLAGHVDPQVPPVAGVAHATVKLVKVLSPKPV